MIRNPTSDGWDLILQTDHAEVSATIARHWKNDQFEPPKPFAHVLDAIAHHDDSWKQKDNKPTITDDGEPNAFGSDLDDAYSVFRGYNLEEYLTARKQVAEASLDRDLYAAVLISMHSVDLLTTKTDAAIFTEDEQRTLDKYIDQQTGRQSEWKQALREQPGISEYATEERFERAFKFLQNCDYLSLLVCSGCQSEVQLHHEHPTTDGSSTAIQYKPIDNGRYSCDPWPFDTPELDIQIPCKHVSGKTFSSDSELTNKYADAETKQLAVTLTSS